MVKNGKEASQQGKKLYEKPTATRLTREQAMLKIMGQAAIGDQEAKQLLETLFEEAGRNGDAEKHKTGERLDNKEK
jgi:hypothetical protein